jgi:hypothetical protein
VIAHGTKKTVGRPAALVRAEHGGATVHLTGAEKKVLDEALRRGEDLREELETKTLEYGRCRRAGGPTLGVTRHLLYVALRIAANDRRITAAAWRGLD